MKAHEIKVFADELARVYAEDVVHMLTKNDVGLNKFPLFTSWRGEVPYLAEAIKQLVVQKLTVLVFNPEYASVPTAILIQTIHDELTSDHTLEQMSKFLAANAPSRGLWGLAALISGVQEGVVNFFNNTADKRDLTDTKAYFEYVIDRAAKKAITIQKEHEQALRDPTFAVARRKKAASKIQKIFRTKLPELKKIQRVMEREKEKDLQWENSSRRKVLAVGLGLLAMSGPKVRPYIASSMDGGVALDSTDNISKSISLAGVERHVYASNYDRLQANKTSTAELVKNCLLHSATTAVDVFRELDARALNAARDVVINGISYEAAKDGYASIIEKLEERRDYLRHITRTISTEHSDGTRDLIRDGRAAINTKVGRSESFVVQYVNLCQAAELLLDVAVNNGDINAKQLIISRNNIRDRAKAMVHNLGKEPLVTGNLIKRRNAELLSFLGDIKKADGSSLFSSKETLKEDCGHAKELVQLDMPQYHISTISAVAGRAVVESAIMALGTTTIFKVQFESIIAGRDQPEWYNTLDKVKQGLVKNYAARLAEGNMVVPTQLYALIPGLRNAYSKVTSVVESDSSLTKVAENLHSGTPTYHGDKKSRLAATKNTLNQAQTFCASGQKLGIISLNSSSDITSNDPAIVELSVKAVASTETTLVLNPLNSRRSISKDSTDGVYNLILKEVAHVATAASEECKKTSTVGDCYAIVAEFLTKGNALLSKERQKRAFTALKILDVERYADPILVDLKIAVEAKMYLVSKPNIIYRFFADFVSTIFRIRPKNNTNLDLVATMPLVAQSMSPEGTLGIYAAVRNIDIVHARVFLKFCKSGKDRTALAELHTSFLAASRYLGIIPSAENLAQMVNAGHAQTMAGQQGGSRGCYGMLTSNDRHMSTIYPDNLVEETANYTNIKTPGWRSKFLHLFRASSIEHDALSGDISSLRTPNQPVVVSTQKRSVNSQNYGSDHIAQIARVLHEGTVSQGHHDPSFTPSRSRDGRKIVL